MMDEIKKAIALKYDKEKDNAPKVVGKGKGITAEKIIQVAEENGIYIKEDPELLEILSTLDFYEEIPEELYKAVAEILVFVYKNIQK